VKRLVQFRLRRERCIGWRKREIAARSNSAGFVSRVAASIGVPSGSLTCVVDAKWSAVLKRHPVEE